MQEELRRIARTSGHITHGDAVKLEHAADLIEAQAAQLQEAQGILRAVYDLWDFDDDDTYTKVRAFIAK